MKASISSALLTQFEAALRSSSFISGSVLIAPEVDSASLSLAGWIGRRCRVGSVTSRCRVLEGGRVGRSGWRFSIATASARTLPLLFTGNAVFDQAPPMWPPMMAIDMSPVPL